MLLLTDLTSAPDDKSIGIEYCQKIHEKVLPIPISILYTKSIADTIGSNFYQYCDVNPDKHRDNRLFWNLLSLHTIRRTNDQPFRKRVLQQSRRFPTAQNGSWASVK